MEATEDAYCTCCNIYFDEGKLERVCQHLVLPVPICGPCYDDCEKKVKLALSNNDMCIWCGEGKSIELDLPCPDVLSGGDLFMCDECDKSICRNCIVANMPSGTVEEIDQQDSWVCFSCDSTPLQDLSDVFSRYNEIQWFPPDLEGTIELLGLVEDQISLCEEKNDPDRWSDFERGIKDSAVEENCER